MPQEPDQPAGPPPGGYRWPWFVAAAVILAIILAILWMTQEIRKVKRQRELNSSPAAPGWNETKTPH